MSGRVHFVTVTAQFDQDGTELNPDVKFECRGDKSSDCHRYPDCDCESWGDDHSHPKIVHDDCWIKDWFDADCHAYDGDDRDEMNGDWGIPAGMNRSGEVKTSFEVDYISWEFTEPTK